MMTINLGPLALPLPPLLLLAFLMATGWVLRRMAPQEDREAADTALWWGAAAGLLTARMAHVMSHMDSYAPSAMDMLDIRDGGFMALPGALAGLAVMGWRVQRTVSGSRRMALLTAGAGVLLWWLSSAGLERLRPAPGQALSELAVRLHPVMPDGQGAASSAPGAVPGGLTLPEVVALAGGKPVVINLWASWCGPCRAEMPMLAQAQREHPQVLFLFANQGESEAAVRAYLQRERLPLTDVWIDRASALGPALGSGGLPTTVVFDAQGRRRAAHMGALNPAGLRVLLQQAQARP